MENIEALTLSSITVDTLVDENNGSLAEGHTSLREAIAAVAPGGTIQFDSALAQNDAGFGSGVIGLTLGELVIDKSVSITGLGVNKLSVSGNQQSRVFLLDDGDANSAIDVAISGLTVSNGKAEAQASGQANGRAGGILSAGENLTFTDGALLENSGAIATTPNATPNATGAAVTIRRSTIFNSEDFGISTSGDLKIVDSQLINNAGIGVEHSGNLILRRAGVNNSAGSGIVSDGGLSVLDSQVESNGTEGIRHSGTAVIQNSSITGNGSEGIISVGSTALNLINSTIESNGADGILTSGVVAMKESSIANNAGNGITFLTDQFNTEDLKVEDSFIVGNAGVEMFVDSNAGLPKKVSGNVISDDAKEAITPGQEATPPTKWIEGTRGRDKISGTRGSDLIRAFMGRDTIYGRGGNDLIEGGRGKDRIFGGNGKDQLFGGAGDDVLGGGRGRDLLKGGKGRDVFVFGGLYEGRDRILDFKVGADLIDLSAIFANEQYDSAAPFDDYIQLGSAGSEGTRLAVLDVNRSTDTRSVFKAIAIIENTAPAEIGEKSFVL